MTNTKQNPKKQTNIELDPVCREKLVEISKRTSISISALVRSWINKEYDAMLIGVDVAGKIVGEKIIFNKYGVGLLNEAKGKSITLVNGDGESIPVEHIAMTPEELAAWE